MTLAAARLDVRSPNRILVSPGGVLGAVVSRRTVVAGMVATTLAMAGCADGDAPAARGGGVLVTYLTGLGIYGQESYMWVGIDKGFFRDVGIEVEIEPGRGSAANLRSLHEGRADFAALDTSGAQIEFMAGRSRGSKLVAAIHQLTVLCVSALEGRGIAGPKDLEGRRVGYVEGGVNYQLFPSYAIRAGVDPSKIDWVPVDGQQLPSVLASGRVDAVTYLVSSKGALEAAAKRKTVNLAYAEYMPALYGNGVAASAKTLATRPEVAKAFASAVVRSLVYALEHPDEAGAIFARYQPGYPAATAASETALIKAYAVAGGAAIGTFDRDRVARSIAMLQDLGFGLGRVTPEDLVAFDLAPAG